MTEDNMSDTELWLKPEPLKPGQWMDRNPVRINFSLVSHETSGVNAKKVSWSSMQSDGDYRTTNQFLNQLQEMQVNGVPFIKFIKYNGVYFWQFLPSYVWPTFFRTIEFIKILAKLIKETSPDVLRVFPARDCNYSIWIGLVKAAAECYKVKIVLEKAPISNLFYSPKDWIKLQFDRTGLSGISRKLSNAALGFCSQFLINRRNSDKQSTGNFKKIALVSFGRHWVKMPGNSGRFYDEQFYPLLPSLRNAGWNKFLLIDCPYSLNSLINIFFKKLRNSEHDVSHRYFYSFGSIVKFKLLKIRSRRNFAKQWKIIENDPLFSDSFRFLGIKLFPALKSLFRFSFLVTLPECAQMLAVASDTLKNEKPEAVVLTYETGPYQRALIIAARRMGIPTIGLMHGFIFNNNCDYMHSSVVVNDEQGAIGFSVPDAFCVWGDLWKSNLTFFGHYPSDAISVTGNWRYDFIPEIYKSIDMNKLKVNFSITEGKKTALILSGGLDSLDYVEKCLSVLSQSDNIRILVKLHPADNPEPVLKLFEKFGLPKNTLVTGQLTEVLLVCDFAISQISTVLSEAALLGKDIILVDFQGLKGWDLFLEKSFFLVARNPDELRSAISCILNAKSVRANLSKSRSKFVNDCFYNVDGHAAERVVSKLEDLLNRKA